MFNGFHFVFCDTLWVVFSCFVWFLTLVSLSAVSRAQISAPPGFSVPSRAPPPGFTSHERVDQDFDSVPGWLSTLPFYITFTIAFLLD